jgi:hypothetical protein
MLLASETSYEYTTACRWKMTGAWVVRREEYLSAFSVLFYPQGGVLSSVVRCKQHLSTLSVIFHLQAVV